MNSISNPEALEWIERFESCDETGLGEVSAQFAQAIWNKKISEENQIELLSSGSARIRSSLAWAISDKMPEGDVLDFLVCSSIDDENPTVRGYSILAIRNLGDVNRFSEKMKTVSDDDPDEGVKKMAKKLLDEWDSNSSDKALEEPFMN